MLFFFYFTTFPLSNTRASFPEGAKRKAPSCGRGFSFGPAAGKIVQIQYFSRLSTVLFSRYSFRYSSQHSSSVQSL